MSRAASKRAGENAEAAVVQRVPELEAVVVRDAHIDAEAVAAIWPSTIPMVGISVVESGTAVEIKSCSAVVTAAQDRGRFYLRQTQHDYLRDQGGVYLFAVTPPHDDRPLALKFVPATIVGDAVPSWHDLDGRETYARLTWSRIFDPAAVGPHAGGS